ncbi:MAG: thioredoxin fold domain-containing protein [Gammaproteobacteria bacterium]|nr:thioredoxin fold domain-containing protein [Gammaproteobacteria bacterium]
MLTAATVLFAGLALLGLPMSGLGDTPEPSEVFEFEDFPLREPLTHPTWFKQSFLDLPWDLQEAIANDKRGIIVYFGQQRCAYCKLLMTANFGQNDISHYTQTHFDIIPIDIWGIDEVTDLNGETLTERELAIRENTNFTPSLIFYDAHGTIALRLRGYYPPYKFRAALEFVADGHYRNESFSAYLERASGALAFDPGELNDESFFAPPPYALDRSRFPGERPLAVFFEQGDCHACDVLHAQPLAEPTITDMLDRFENIQLNIHTETPVITPSGEKTTAKDWAKALGLFYTPSILFFDERGREVIRLDSVVQFYRLRNVLTYIANRGYVNYPDYQRWRVDNPP